MQPPAFMTTAKNEADAADPQAIGRPLPRKEPVYDNDPERDVTQPERLTGTMLVIFSLAAIAMLATLTLLLFL